MQDGMRMEPPKSVATTIKRGTSLAPEDTRILCAFIKRLCARLELKANVICSALVLFHRFHARHIPGAGAAQFDDYDLAAACVFVACKVEECITKVDRITEASNILRTGKPFDDAGAKWNARERTFLCERILLDTISYDIVIEHAHFHSVTFSRHITEGDKEGAKQLYQIASNILNDSLFTNLCLRHEPRLMGAAAVRLAGRSLRHRMKGKVPYLDELERMEMDGNVFGFSTQTLHAMEDELVSTYEFGTTGNDAAKRMRKTSADDASMDSD